MRVPSFIATACLLTAFGIVAATPASAQYHHRPAVRCESRIDDGERRTFCPLPTRFGVHIGQQLSRTPCIRGRNWFISRGGIFVRGGCRAVFVANQRGYGALRPY